MALAKQNKNFFDFVGGIFTEGSPLNRPPNTSVSEKNFEILKNGYRRRRHGLGLQPDNPTESAYCQNSTGVTIGDANKFKTYTWTGVNGDPSLTILVVKNLYKLDFFKEVSGEYIKLGAQVDLTGQNTATQTLEGVGLTSTRQNIIDSDVCFSSGFGYLFMAGKYVDPCVFSYDVSNDEIITRTFPLIERDLEGADDGLAADTKPSTNTSNHQYNLTNQGWTAARWNAWQTAQGNYPSNSMIWTYGKYVDPSTGIEDFSADHLSWQDFGEVPAPKGRFKQYVFHPGSSYQSTHIAAWITWKTAGVTQFYEDQTGSPNTVLCTTDQPHQLATNDYIYFTNASIYRDSFDYMNRHLRDLYVVHSVPSSTTFTFSPSAGAGTDYDFGGPPSTPTYWYPLDDMIVIKDYGWTGNGQSTNYGYEQVEFHAQRTFWAGHDHSTLNTRIYFSQILDKVTKVNKCYQANDPTSEYLSDLLPNDGGYISIPDMGHVLKLVSFGHYLIVFAENGIWSVGPGDLGYFTADNFAVSRLSRAEVIHPNAIVNTDNEIFYWTTTGLFMINAETVTKSPMPQNLSDGVFQTLYNEIIQAATMVQSAYDEVQHKIYWLYRDDQTNGATTYDWQLTQGLILDLAVRAIYQYSFYYPNSTYPDHQIVDIVSMNSYYGDQKKIKILARTPSEGATRKLYWYEFNNDSTFTDFADFVGSGVGYAPPCYLMTTYEMGDDAARRKFGTYLTAHFNRTETEAVVSGDDLVLSVPSSCMLKVRWDWTTTTYAGKQGTEREIYRLKRYYQPDVAGTWDNGLPVTTTKNKIRGSGKALQLYFRVPDYHDCQLLGWQLTMTGVTEV